MLNAIRAYKTYIMSVSSFVAQTESPPIGWAQHERENCKLFFKGHVGSIITGCLQNLTSVGFPADLPEFPCIAVAAKSKVFLYENLKNGGLDMCTSWTASSTIATPWARSRAGTIVQAFLPT